MWTDRFTLVVGLDASEYAEIVLEHAIDQAARHDAADLHLVSVAAPNADLGELKRRITQLVEPALAALPAPWRARVHLLHGDPANEIANLAADVRAHMIVVGRFGLHRGRLGRVAAGVIAAAPCPTLVVGLVDRSPDRVPQCPACVAVRAASDGERWFCAEHAAPDRDQPLTTFVSSTSFTGGGLLW